MISGLLFGMFLPGFFISLIFFKEAKWLERILLSITYSIMITIAIAIGLGYNEAVKNITGGITSFNLWKWELIITSILALITIIMYRKNIPTLVQSLKNVKKRI
jgi:uncharacterized membrane protein